MPPPLSQDDFEHDLQGGGYQEGGYQDGGYQDGFQARPESAVAPAYASGSLPPPPVPLSAPPPPLRSLDAPDAAHNGSNGSARLAGEAGLGGFAEAVRAPVASTASALLPPLEMASIAPAPMPRAGGDDTRSKMMAALATGMLIGFIIAKLFF